MSSGYRTFSGCFLGAGKRARSAAFFTPSIAIEESTLARKVR